MLVDDTSPIVDKIKDENSTGTLGVKSWKCMVKVKNILDLTNDGIQDLGLKRGLQKENKITSLSSQSDSSTPGSSKVSSAACPSENGASVESISEISERASGSKSREVKQRLMREDRLSLLRYKTQVKKVSFY